jgi:hypothetical protein
LNGLNGALSVVADINAREKAHPSAEKLDWRGRRSISTVDDVQVKQVTVVITYAQDAVIEHGQAATGCGGRI